MYEIIFWMCLASSPQCDRYSSPTHMYHVMYGQLHSKAECEAAWHAFDASEPDPPGTKANFICQAVETPL